MEVVAGDALDPASLDRALADMEAAYYLIHSLAAGERGFEERDRGAARERVEKSGPDAKIHDRSLSTKPCPK